MAEVGAEPEADVGVGVAAVLWGVGPDAAFVAWSEAPDVAAPAAWCADVRASRV
jgi:hypothetical protein